MEIKTVPRITQRACGGWIATSPEVLNLKIGVVAETEEAAREKFYRTLEKWKETLALGIESAN